MNLSSKGTVGKRGEAHESAAKTLFRRFCPLPIPPNIDGQPFSFSLSRIHRIASIPFLWRGLYTRRLMARKKRLLQMASSSAIDLISEPGDQRRATRSRSLANVADVHTRPSLPPMKRGRMEAANAAFAALPSPNAEGTEEGIDVWQSCGRGEAAAAIAASPSSNAEPTEEVGEQPHGLSKEEAGGDDDHGAVMVADDPSGHDVVVISGDHGNHNNVSKTACDGNNCNPCGGEDKTRTSSTGSAAAHESLETIQTEVANVMSAITTLLEEVQPRSQSSPMETLSSPSSLQKYCKDSANNSRRKRGPTRALDVLLLPKGQKIKVMNNELGQAIGDNANKLSSFMGTLARNGCIAPLTYKDWRMMPQIHKDKMWNCILEKFDIDKCMRRWVTMSISTKWKKWKASLKKEHYDSHETDEERLADCDRRVLPDQWTELVRFWSSEEGTKLCERNKANREKLTCIHTMGTKSFARIREEEKARTSDGSEPSKVEFFIMTHQKKSGQPVDDKASKIIAEFNKLLSELPEEARDRTTQDSIFAQVMGRDQHGRVRTCELGPVPSDFCGPSSSQVDSAASSERRAAVAEEKISELQKRIEQMEQENQNLQQENQQWRHQEKVKAKQAEDRSNLEKQLEEMWQESVELLLGNDKLKESEQRITNLQRQVEETVQENQQLRQENENMKKQIKKMIDVFTNIQ
ncbi:unnamed protein product [Victoria cruziana]